MDGKSVGVNTSISQRYVGSLYWAITMMSTIGFGDCLPGTPNEVLYSALVMMAGAAVFAYSVTNICSVLFGMDIEGSRFAGTQDRMKKMLERRCIQRHLKKRVSKYLLYKYHVSKINMFGGFAVIDSLSANLKEDVLEDFCEGHFKNIEILFLFGNRFVRLLSYHMQGQVFGPEEPIILAGTYCNRIFIVAQGTVEIYWDLKIKPNDDDLKAITDDPETKKPSNNEVSSDSEGNIEMQELKPCQPWKYITELEAQRLKLGEGTSFNEVSCLLRKPSTITAFSWKNVDMFSFTRNAYLSTLQRLYPNDVPKLFIKLLGHADNIKDLDFSLNKNPKKDSTGGLRKRENKVSFTAQNSTPNKLEILKRAYLYQKRHKKNSAEKIKNIFLSNPNEDYNVFWRTIEGFFTSVSPLSVAPCIQCNKKNVCADTYIQPIHEQLCANEKCIQYEKPLLPPDEICYLNSVKKKTIRDWLSIDQEKTIKDQTKELKDIKILELKDLNAKIKRLRRELEEHNKLLLRIINKNQIKIPTTYL